MQRRRSTGQGPAQGGRQPAQLFPPMYFIHLENAFHARRCQAHAQTCPESSQTTAPMLRSAVALRMFAGWGVNAVTARHAGRPRAEAGRPFAPASGLEWRRDARSHRPQSRRHADGGAREPTPACKPDARMQVKQAVAQTPPRQGGVRPHGGACANSKIPIQSHRILL